MVKKQTDMKENVVEESKPTKSYYEGVGRRKESSARVRLYVALDGDVEIAGKQIARGSIIINDKDAEVYFRGEMYKKMYLEPFRTTNTMNRFVTSIHVGGGGASGQLGAIIHGISRALLVVDGEKFRPILKKRGFLTRDPRAKERRKAGFAHKARARKQSPKR